MAKKPLPSKSLEPMRPVDMETPSRPWWKWFYDRDAGTYCDRTCISWLYLITYSIMYVIFLSTYTMLVLYVSLSIVKSYTSYLEKSELMYFQSGVGLTATPTGENNSPLIWYRKGEASDYMKYVNALEKLVSPRKVRDVDGIKSLGPCSEDPFGYGDAPCVIVRINKQWGWNVKPLQGSSLARSDIPPQVRQWAERDAKLWLHCGGYYPHDVEHIGSIKYYPDPPGFDPKVFPLDKNSESPLIAFQLSNFTLGVSIVVECRLWYEDGESKVNFVLYVGARRNKFI